MWSFVEVVRVEQNWGEWYALVLLEKSGVQEGAFVRFHAQPTAAEVEAAGREQALRRNIADAPLAPGRTISRAEFVGRFTLTEIGAIYQAAASNATILAFTKRLELTDTVDLDSDDAVAGLALLEQSGFIAAGRAAKIRGA